MYEVEIRDLWFGGSFWIDIDAQSVADAELQAGNQYGRPRYGIRAIKAEEVPYPESRAVEKATGADRLPERRKS